MCGHTKSSAKKPVTCDKALFAARSCAMPRASVSHCDPPPIHEMKNARRFRYQNQSSCEGGRVCVSALREATRRSAKKPVTCDTALAAERDAVAPRIIQREGRSSKRNKPRCDEGVVPEQSECRCAVSFAPQWCAHSPAGTETKQTRWSVARQHIPNLRPMSESDEEYSGCDEGNGRTHLAFARAFHCM